MPRNRVIAQNPHTKCATINLAALCVVLVTAGICTAQSINYIGSTLWSGVPDVEVVDTLAYCSFQNGLQILDISDPTSPQFVSQVMCPGRGEGLDINGNFAYLANGDSGLCVIDISNPLAPTLVARIDIGGFTMDVSYENGFAFLATWWHGLQIVDVRDPLHPGWHNGVPSSGGAWGIDVSNNLAALADGNAGVMLIDVEFPEAAFVYGSVSAPNFAHDVELSDTLLFAGSTGGSRPGLYIYDVSDPSAPESLGRAPTPVWHIEIEGDYAYIANLYSGLIICDISDPSNPSVVRGWFNPEWSNNIAVCAKDSIVYLCYGESEENTVTWGNSGVYALNVSDPAAPVLLGGYSMIGRSYDIALKDTVLYVANYSGAIKTIDISNPEQPEVIGAEEVDAGSPLGARVSIAGDLAIVNSMFASFFVYDISDVRSPVRIGSFRNEGTDTEEFLQGTLVYHLGFRHFGVVTLANLPSIDSIGSCPLPRTGQRLDVQFPFAYVVGSEYFWTVDITDSTAPTVLYSDSIFSAIDVKVDDDLLWATMNDSSLALFDLSDPVVPQEIERIPLQGGIGIGLDTEDSLAWVALGSVGVRLYRLDSESGLQFVASYSTPGYARSVLARDGFAYVADDFSTLILEYDRTSGDIHEVNAPTDYEVLQNYPNPFNNSTRINFLLERSGRTSLRVYDILGREVATLLDEVRDFGPQTVQWDAQGQASGVYFARLMQGDQSRTLKMVLLR